MTYSHYEVHSSVVQRCRMTISGNDWWKRYVFSRCWNVKRDGEDWRWTGNEFQKMDAATGNERRPMVVRRYGGMSSWSVDDDRRRRRLGRSDTGTSWFRYSGAIPCSTRYATSASLKLTCSGRRMQPVEYREGVGHVVVATKFRSWITKWAAALSTAWRRRWR